MPTCRKPCRRARELLTGGHPLKQQGNYYAPTVLTNIPKGSPAYGEEFFGPVASIFRVKDQDEAIRIANDVRFGLGASAWTNDDQERERFINELEAGSGVHQQDGRLRSADSFRRSKGFRARAGAGSDRHPRVRQRKNGVGGLEPYPVARRRLTE